MTARFRAFLRSRYGSDLALARDHAHRSEVAVVSNVESEFYMGYRRTEANNMGEMLYLQQGIKRASGRRWEETSRRHTAFPVLGRGRTLNESAEADCRMGVLCVCCEEYSEV